MHSVPDHQRDHRACPAAKHDLDVWRAPSFSQESFRCQTRPTPRQLNQRQAQFISCRWTSRVASSRRWQKYDDSERNGPKAQRSKCRSPKIPSQAPAFISIASWTSLLTLRNLLKGRIVYIPIRRPSRRKSSGIIPLSCVCESLFSANTYFSVYTFSATYVTARQSPSNHTLQIP